VDLEREIKAGAERLAATSDPAYVARARAGAARLAPIDVAAGDVRGALALVSQHVEIDPVVPVRANRREVEWAKTALRRGLVWYGRWLAQQTTLLGQAVVRLGTATAERLEQIEADGSALRASLAALEQRVAELEGADHDAEPAGRRGRRR